MAPKGKPHGAKAKAAIEKMRGKRYTYTDICREVERATGKPVSVTHMTRIGEGRPCSETLETAIVAAGKVLK